MLHAITTVFFLFVLGTALTLVSSPAAADLLIRKNDGTVIRVPVDPSEVKGITFAPGGDKEVKTPTKKRPSVAERVRQRELRNNAVESLSDDIATEMERLRRLVDEAETALREAESAARIARAAAEAAAKADRASGARTQSNRAQSAARRANSASDAVRRANEKANQARAAALAAARAVQDGNGAPGTISAKRTNRTKSVAERAAGGRTLKVGTGQRLATPSAAAKIARDGDIIEIQAGEYVGDVAIWRANRLTLRGVGGRVHLRAAGRNAEGKGTWVVKGDDTLVENIAFYGAKVRDRNGAGIRLEGTNLTVRNSYFRNNENGILTGRNRESSVVVENSEFAGNGNGSGRTHAIYIGQIKSFTLVNSYSHGTRSGHNVKTRARRNFIAWNRIADEAGGTASYQIDISNGGKAVVIGNVIQQSPKAENQSIVSFAAEGRGAGDRLILAHNTLVNMRHNAVFVQNRSKRPIRLVNNIFAGDGKVITGTGRLENNLIVRRLSGGRAAGEGPQRVRVISEGALAGNMTAASPGFVDPTRRDYRIARNSPAVDRGIQLSTDGGIALVPEKHYAFPKPPTARTVRNKPDLGAFEAGS